MFHSGLNLFREALRQAGENYRMSQRRLYDSAKADPDVQAYLEAVKDDITPEAAREEADALASRLFARTEKGWIAQHMDEYEQGFEKFKEALRRFTRGESKSLPRAITDQGLDAPEQALYPVLAYAGRQMVTAETQAEKAGSGERKELRAGAMDAEYMRAVENGDEETEQRIVDEAAKEAGYTPVVRYHQTGAEFTVFSNANPEAGANDDETPNGIFFKDNDHDIGVGGDYVKTGHGGSVQMPVYLKTENMLHFKDRKDARAWYMKNVPGYKEESEAWDKRYNEKYKPQFDAIEDEEFNPETTAERYEELDQQEEALIKEMGEEERKYRRKTRETLNNFFIDGNSGYDGIELDYDGHRYIDGKRENVHTYIVFNNTQVKSADPVTYDDNGEVIPPSERFNEGKGDIRFEMRAPGRGSQEDYSYDALVAKPDMEITRLKTVTNEELNELREGSKSDFASDVLNEIKNRNGGTTTIYNPDSKRNVFVGRKSIIHSIPRKITKGAAEVSFGIDSIIKNAVAANEMNEHKGSNFATVLLGIGETDESYYGVRIIVNNYSSEAEKIDVVHAISKSEIKKEGVVLKTLGLPTKSDTNSPSKIRIADFLNLVKDSKLEFPYSIQSLWF